MTDIGKGDWVECIEARQLPGNTRPPKLQAGTVYFVTGLGVCRHAMGTEPGVALLDVIPSVPSGFYRMSRFRPLRKPPSIADILYSSRKEPA